MPEPRPCLTGSWRYLAMLDHEVPAALLHRRASRQRARYLDRCHLPAPNRSRPMYVGAFIAGAVLFFLTFAAIFNGSWVLLIFFLLCYAAAGAAGVRFWRVAPSPLAFALVIPALPWVLWLFPGSVMEAGVLRALLWPGIVALAGGLAWLGGTASARFQVTD